MLPTSRYYETLVRVQNAGLEAYREVYVKCLFLDAYGAIVADGSGLITNLAARSTDATTVQGSPDTRPPVSAECRVNAAVK